MKLKVICTPLGLQPIYEEDYDSKKKLKVGECYTAEIRLIRNLQFHKKAFSLLNTAWSLLPERTQNGFRSIDAFRDTITVAAGFVDVFYDMNRKCYCEKPKSWSFDSMDNAEFDNLYNALKDVIWGILSSRTTLTQEIFEQYLMNY